MRPAVVLAVAVLVAGCSGPAGFGPGESATPDVPEGTLTPVAVPDDAPNPRLTPGAIASGEVDPRALVVAHARATLDTSYTVRVNRTVTTPNGTLLATENRTARVSAGGAPFFVTVRTRGPASFLLGATPMIGEFYSNGRRLVWNVSRGDRWQHGRTPPRLYTERLSEFLALSRPDPADRVGGLAIVEPRVEGRTDAGTLLTATTARRPNALPVAPTIRDVHDVDLRAVVTDEGVVRSYRLHYAATWRDRPVRVFVAVEYTRLGETRMYLPEWYAEVPGVDTNGTIDGQRIGSNTEPDGTS